MQRTQAVLSLGVSQGITPGLAACISRQSGENKHFCYGQLSAEIKQEVDADTIYDLASLTKVLCTTLLCAQALEENKLALDEQPWPQWPKVTVAHMLQHCSGLPAWKPFFEEPKKTHNEIIEQVLATPLDMQPGRKTVYSDLGFIALGDLLERRFKAPLKEPFLDASKKHYGPNSLHFVDLMSQEQHPHIERVAPTGHCSWRQKMVRGEVHDQNCYAMGGVAGHAGLFGSLNDVEIATRWFMDALYGQESGIKKIIREFAHYPGKRGLGFDRPEANGSTGQAFSQSAVGHLGFTGVSMWMNAQEKGAFSYILLTNRIHIDTPLEKMKQFRVAFHEAAASEY